MRPPCRCRPLWPARPPPADKQLTNTGLERSEPLAKDIAYMQQQWGMEAPVAAEDGPGHTYAKCAGAARPGSRA